VEDLDRSSFSTRFFARSNSSHPHSPWFDTLSSTKTEREFSGTETQALLQEDDLENNPGRLLAAERERLKLRERQVQRSHSFFFCRNIIRVSLVLRYNAEERGVRISNRIRMHHAC
jgi:hypothetical protein